MSSPRSIFLPLGSALLFLSFAVADEPKAKDQLPAAKSVEGLAKELRPSIVVITTKGRDSNRDTIGTGFIIAADGLIATNWHVIGEHRPIAVEMADGKKFDVVSIQAGDRERDLALIKIAAKDLPVIPLGDSDALKDGQPVFTIGNPHGLKHSVAAGVVASKRDIGKQSLIQIAVPVEPGNSGGPVLDMQGRAQGIVALKLTESNNLGFAVPINALKPLIKKPVPISMEQWVTIGMLDPDEWKPLMGASWRQRAGRIKVAGSGTGFGGRSVCIFQPKAPEMPYEVAVTVKLDDEAGAAGLLFHHDGERHYGFYPTGGKLRLTRFDGPDVFSWKILSDAASPHYRPGEWNTIKVRVAKDGVKCFVNGQLAIESDDAVLTEGQVGLAKFRNTAAEFRNFRVGKKIETSALDPAEAAKLIKPLEAVAPGKPVPAKAIGDLAKQKGSVDALRDRAHELEQQASRLRELAGQVREKIVYDELSALLAKPEAQIDLVHAALLLAKLDSEEVDVDAYRAEFERMTKKLAAALPKKADDQAKLEALNKFFFEQRGFHGSGRDYYSRSNSFINEVLDDREGLPITLSVLYSELGNRIGLKLAGIGLPGHFVVRQMKEKGDGPFIDVFENGKTFSLDEAKKRITDRGAEFRDEDVQPTAKKAIIARMLRNLLGVAQEESDAESVLRYLNGILICEPESHHERLLRHLVRYNKGMKKEALDDLNFVLDRLPEDAQPRGELLRRKRMLERELDN